MRIDELLSRYRDGTPEREYHEAFLKVLSTIEFPRSEDAGLNLLHFLQVADLVIGSVDTTCHPAAGSRHEDAMLVAAVFADVNSDPDWWLDRYRERDWQSDQQWLRYWRDRFRASRYVERVDVWIVDP
jgi:hypothetical protein